LSSPRRPASSAAASRLTAVLAVVAALSTIAGISVRAAEAPPAEPNDYRLGNYRSPTPQTLKGARVVTTAQAEALWKGGNAVFVDVLPRPPKPRNLPAGTIWHEKPRPDVPGSVWLPDTGYGALAPSVEAYLRAGLEKATHGDRGKALVIYCQRNCWMSWNAAKRAIAIGYANVIWYPDGTDGWSAAGLPLKQATPEPRTAE
jgi:PQQ-dependent catabolism-associated CXXCW motif protein